MGAKRQVQRFLGFAEDIEYYGSRHGGLPLDEKIAQLSHGLSEKGCLQSMKKIVFNP